jgi:CRISPR system Cascade subunit CasA
MTLWRRDEKTGAFTPKRHNPARQLWRDFEALIVCKDGGRVPGVVRWNERLSYEGLIGDTRLKFSAPSVKYGDKDFFADDMFSDAVSLNARLLGRLSDIWQTQIVEILKVTDDAVLLFGRFALDLALAGGADDEKNNKASIRADAREQAYGELDIPFRNWLAAIKGDEDINAVLIAWKHSVRNILLKLANGRLDAAGDAAFIGRKGNTAFTAELNFKARLKETLNLPGTERRDNE